MKSPQDAFQAVFKHLVLKDVDVVLRKEFMAAFHKAHTDELKLKAIGDWVQLRDVATFPFAKKDDSDESQGDTGGVSVDDDTDGDQDTGDAPE